ncbi:aspartate aminotransferase family protein [Alicyclobacillus tolerans]|uniref:aminotransferase family protein n=1 Tax=Alicyclobacillus tolerans TaxID=90970 RepID=UPI001F329D8C|nr:aspartate aminotransferase family protein [Alicyclobacillus tolerans]MCF8566787.1 aspartate aminotransferase family protein [Alicyclobacillus tolerans]
MSDELARLSEIDRNHYLHPTTSVKEHFNAGPALVFERGQGVYLYDVEGKEYIDGMASLWNVNIGHGRKELAQAALDQMSTLAYSHSFSNFSHRPVIELSEKLASYTPGDLNVFFYASGGSESNDSAIKLIRHYFKMKGQPQRVKILARHRAYHGISIGATSATGIGLYREMAPPLAPGFLHGPAPHCYHCELGMDPASCELACAKQELRKLIEQEGPDTVAAIMAEPIQGAGGVIVPPAGYMKAIRELCDEYGILMFTDEVITGFGRTGRWFGIEHEGVQPDVMTFAKGVTSGYFPFGGVAIRQSLHEELSTISSGTFAHGFTYSGHPTGCAVAIKNLEILDNEKLIENSDKMGEILRKGLLQIEASSPFAANVMSRGLLASIEIVQDKSTRQAFPQEASIANQVFQQCLKRGVIVRPLNIDGTSTIALSPPLVIHESQVDTVVNALAESIEAAVTTSSVSK